jgi:hypothetical protein
MGRAVVLFEMRFDRPFVFLVRDSRADCRTAIGVSLTSRGATVSV